MEPESHPTPDNPLDPPRPVETEADYPRTGVLSLPESNWELPPGLRLRYQPEPATKAAQPPESFFRRLPGWVMAPTILLAGLLAHGLCVGSTFYFEDWNLVVANDRVDHGLWWEAGPHALTYLTYWLTYLLRGFSAPAFHAGNLLFHLATALVVAGFARRLLEEGANFPAGQARRVGWWAGLLFAVHPLCSEVPNYVRARDIELATLFSLLAAWTTVRWRRQRRPRLGWPLLTLLFILAATLCKEVGFVLAAGMAMVVWFGLARAPEARGRQAVALPLPGPATRVKTKLVATPKDASIVRGEWPATLSLVLVGVCIALIAWPAWLTAARAFRHPLLGWHILTKARVFWLGMGRVLVPIRLCSDHQIAWTRGWNDPVAWVALWGELAVAFWTGILYFRQRGPARVVGILLALTLLTVVHRLANPEAALMVEYRFYPGIAPLCVLLAWGVDRMTGLIDGEKGRTMAASLVMIALVAAGIVLSVRRAQTWQSTESLVADVLSQYPLQNRARKELQDADVRAEYWTETLRQQPAMRVAVAQLRNFNARSPVRNYDVAPTITIHIATEGNYALALAHLRQTKQAMIHLNWITGSLPAGAMKEPLYEAEWLYARGRVEAATQQNEAAVRDFNESQRLAARPETERALRRVQTEMNLP